MKQELLIDSHEDSNLRSTDFAIRYSTCWRIINSCSYCSYLTLSIVFVGFLSVGSTGDIDTVIVQLKSNARSIHVGFHYSHLVEKSTVCYIYWGLLNCSGENSIRDFNNSWSMIELFKWVNVSCLSKYFKGNWNIEFTLAENCFYVLAITMNCALQEKKEDRSQKPS